MAKASHEVVQEAINAGVWVFGGGLENQKASIVATNGTVTDGPYPEAIGGLCVVEVPSHKEALEWAAKTASACRCAVEVWEFMPDPETDEMLRQADSRRLPRSVKLRTKSGSHAEPDRNPKTTQS